MYLFFLVAGGSVFTMWNKQWLYNSRWRGRTEGLLKSPGQEIFWDIWNRTEWYGISGDEAILSELKLLLARAGILFTFLLFCAAVLNYATDLVLGPQALICRVQTSYFCHAELFKNIAI